MCKKTIALLLVAVMLMTALVACNDNSTTVPADTTEPITDPPEETTPQDTPIQEEPDNNDENDEPINDPDAPIAYFSFDELSENQKFVEEKSKKECQSTGNPVQDTGKNGKSLFLDGKSSLTVDVELPKGNEAFSIAAWIKPTTSKINASKTHVIAGWGDYSKSLCDVRMQIYKGKLCTSSRGVHSCNTIPSDAATQWHHFAVSYANKQFIVYLDGEHLASFSASKDLSVADTPLYIGNFDGYEFYFPRYIDDLYIFDREITEAEVKGCMENVKDFSKIDKESGTVVSNVTFKQLTGMLKSTVYCPGVECKYTISVPQFSNVNEYALIVTLDGLNSSLAQVMANLYEEGVAPPTVVVGISNQKISATQSGGTNLNARQYVYDVFDDAFPNFIVEELLPYVTKIHRLKISDSPDMHMAAGGSSGGICAWSCAWFRNDYFHRVYMSSPTFSAITKGYMAPIYMRLYETKAIKGFMDYSENEPNEYFGSSWLVAQEAEWALKYASYDFGFRYNKGEGHNSQKNSIPGLTEMARYVWKDWNTKSIVPTKNTKYIESFVSATSKWTAVNEEMPASFRAISAGGEYTFEAGTIYFTPSSGDKREVATGFGNITSLAVSSDMWRLYIADSTVGSVYAMSIENNGNLKDKMLLASLYTNTDFKVPGAIDLCVDSYDRIYAVTELGIQVIRSYGPIEAILVLPDGQIPCDIAFGGKNNSYMYAKCGDTVYRRPWKIAGRASETSTSSPVTRDYYTYQ